MNKEIIIVLILSGAIFLMFPNASAQSSNADTISSYPVFNSVFGKYLTNPTLASPTGIATYGLNNENGVWSPQIITTNTILAKAEINSLDAYNPNPSSQNYGTNYMNNGEIHGANLQLNAVLYVRTTSGIQVYWLQNTNRFDIEDQEINSPRDLIFNLSSGGCAPLNEEGGKGSVGSCVHNQQSYSYGTDFQAYHLPLVINNGIAVQMINGVGVKVIFYNKPFGNGVFDTVLLSIPDVVSSSIVASPFSPNKVSITPSDVEYVWIGFCCNEKTTFKNMDSYLQTYYKDLNGKLDNFPSLFTFGSETAERAKNLQVMPYGYKAHVIVGTQNNSFLGEIRPTTNNENLPLSSELDSSASTSNMNTIQNLPQIPSWIKNNAKLWSEGSMDDSTFISGIQYMMKNGIIQIPSTQSGSTTLHQIPSWVKNNAKWWAEGQLSDDDFIKAIQFLITNGIIQINS